MNSLFRLDHPPIVFRIDNPLPDFIADHRLTGGSEVQRLDECLRSWNQFLAGLSTWEDEATFSLIFASDGQRVHILFVAMSHRKEATPQVKADIEVRLRSSLIVPQEVSEAEFYQLTELPCPAVQRVRQRFTNTFWKGKPRSGETLPKHTLDNPPLFLPWGGPGGSTYTIVFEALLAQLVPAAVTILYQPTRLLPAESNYLSEIAKNALSASDQSLQMGGSGAPSRSADPSAAIAAKVYTKALETASPALCTVFCTASKDRSDVAQSLAGTLRGLVHSGHIGEASLPTGADAEAILLSHELSLPLRTLRFAPPPREGIDRLLDLMDSRSAATFFRLPISSSGVPGVHVKQSPPDFNPGPRRPSRDGRIFANQFPVKQSSSEPDAPIELGFFHSGGCAAIDLAALTRHTLVTGFTGSGKTNTLFQILHQALENKVPFLVIESAKSEYRGLTQVEALKRLASRIRVYTPGNELLAPLRINPFEILPGMRLESHLGRLQVCFEAAIPAIGPSSSVIAEALHDVYERLGWTLTEECPTDRPVKRKFPVLSDFVQEMEQVIKKRGYKGELLENLTAALVGRFTPLLLGSKGSLFNSQRAHPSIETLLTTPVILELNGLQLEDQALLTLFLLTYLREYRDLHPGKPGELVHLTVVEEAHNILSDVPSQDGGDETATNTRFKAVETFSAMLSEIRSLGEGIVISDQSPQKLAQDAIRNTNLQIAHQLRNSDDRRAIARAMIMDSNQEAYLGKQSTGEAALFYTGLEKAAFIRVNPYDAPRAASDAAQKQYLGYGYRARLSDADLRRYMDSVDPDLPRKRKLVLPLLSCDHCIFATHPEACLRDAVFPSLSADSLNRDLLHLAERPDKMDWWTVVTLAMRLLRLAELPLSLESLWCAVSHVWHTYFRMRKVEAEVLTAENHASLAHDWGAITDQWEKILGGSIPLSHQG